MPEEHVLNYEDFKRQYLGEWWTVDERYQALVERLEQYYKDTPDSMDNKEALKHWKLFKDWCKHNGYTHKEIVRAKGVARHD